MLLVLAENAGDDGPARDKAQRDRTQGALPGKREAGQAVELLVKGGYIELGERPKAETVTYTVVYPGNDPEWMEAHRGPWVRCRCQMEEMVRAG